MRLPFASARISRRWKGFPQAGQAASAWRPSTITFTRTSLVFIMSTLMPAAASDSNMRIATLVWLRMPMPETDSLATCGVLVTPPQPMRLASLLGQFDRARPARFAAP